MSGSGEPARRASDADRERTVSILRDAAVDGRLAHDSFVHRIDIALRARYQESLSELVVDLGKSPGAASGRGPVHATPEGLRLKVNYYPPLPLPSQAAPVLLVGRSARCDFTVEDPSASRLHAVLMLVADRWIIADHGSTNGTFVNGRQLAKPAVVRPGDRAGFGLATYRLMPPGSWADESGP